MLEVHGGLLFWTVVTFLAVLFVLGKFVWRPLLTMLDERENRIQKSLEDAEKAALRAKEAEIRYKETLDTGRSEAMEIVQKSKVTGEKMRDDLIKEARQNAEKLLKDAELRIQTEKEKALQEIRSEAADLIIKATEAILKREVGSKDNQALINETLKAFEKRHEA
jgi:F-type H+-transporting ATPase subunit b